MKNRDLRERLFGLGWNGSRDVTFVWVKGHAGDPTTTGLIGSPERQHSRLATQRRSRLRTKDGTVGSLQALPPLREEGEEAVGSGRLPVSALREARSVGESRAGFGLGGGQRRSRSASSRSRRTSASAIGGARGARLGRTDPMRRVSRGSRPACSGYSETNAVRAISRTCLWGAGR